MSDLYYPTGNAFVALPTIAHTGAIESINVLSMRDRGLLELSGAPFLAPEIEIDGKPADLGTLEWTLDAHWIPVATLRTEGVTVALRYVAPRDSRGWFLRVETEMARPAEIRLRLKGEFAQLLHSVNETKPCRGEIVSYESAWNQGLAFDFRAGTTKVSFGFLTDGGFDRQEAPDGDGRFILEKRLHTPGDTEKRSVHDVYMGIGLEEVGAIAQAIHMQRETGDALLGGLKTWLAARTRQTGDAHMDGILNRNLFFNYFYATGTTLDTEETVLVTSRSPRYYVSAAYWDRDSLIWSFPALQAVDPDKARTALDYVFTRQIRNVGEHSRYIDGVVLEPGFELDELCAPILALDQYVRATADAGYLGRPATRAGIDRILNRLAAWKHPEHDLYGTFLMPTDDMRKYPYLTYNNMLVWKALTILDGFFRQSGETDRAHWAASHAEAVRTAINMHCVATIGGKPQYVWSTDLAGGHDLYDEPPGSLTLFAHYGFCAPDDPVFTNTFNALYSPEFQHFFAGAAFEELGCTHADHPWVLSIANSLLNGRRDKALDMLRRTRMDNLVACESIDARTGEWTTGAHFATCAGFLSYALLRAYGLTSL